MRIVVLADQRAERDALTRMLAAHRRAEVIANEAAAIATIMREPPQIVVFSMPSRGGADLVRRLKGADSSGQAYLIALCDAAPSGRELGNMLEAGAQDFLRRPVIQAELLERLKSPARLVRWVKSLTTHAAFDLSAPVDVAGLRAWAQLGSVVATDFSEMAGAAFQIKKEWSSKIVGELRAATIPMSLAGDQLEVRVSIVVDAAGLEWLKANLLGDPGASDDVADDALRELANTAGGALKRAALIENVTLTTGIPTTEAMAVPAAHMASWTLAIEGSDACLALVGEIRQRSNQRLAASELSEGMIPAHDVRNEDGILLVPAGTRLTTTSAARLGKLLGPRFFLEVASPG